MKKKIFIALNRFMDSNFTTFALTKFTDRRQALDFEN